MIIGLHPVKPKSNPDLVGGGVGSVTFLMVRLTFLSLKSVMICIVSTWEGSSDNCLGGVS